MKSKFKEASMRSKGRSKGIQIWGTAALALTGLAISGLALAAGLTVARAQAPAAEQAPKAAAVPTDGPVLRFTATTANVIGSHDSVRIDLLRWSNDTERNQVPTAWTQAIARAAAIAAAGGRAGAAGRGGRAGRGGAAGAGAADDPDNLSDPTPTANGPGRPLTPEGSLAAALEKAPTLGYVWSSSEISGYAIRYAVRLPQPDGGEHIILITDRRLGDQNDLWNPAAPLPAAKAAAPTAPAAAAPAPSGSSANGAAASDYEFSVIELHLNAKGQGEGKISLNNKIAVDSTAKVVNLANYNDLPVVLKSVDRKTLGKS
jgi:hypothetical protein